MSLIDRMLNDARNDLRRAIKKAENGDPKAVEKVLALQGRIAALRDQGAVYGAAAVESRSVDGKRAACGRWHADDCRCWETP